MFFLLPLKNTYVEIGIAKIRVSVTLLLSPALDISGCFAWFWRVYRRLEVILPVVARCGRFFMEE